MMAVAPRSSAIELKQLSGQFRRQAKAQSVIALLTAGQAWRPLPPRRENNGEVNPDVFCTLVVLSGETVVQDVAPPSSAIGMKGDNAILAMGIFSINRHKQSDIFMKK